MSPAHGFAICCLCVAADLALTFVVGSSPLLVFAAVVCAGVALSHLLRWMS